MRSIKGIGNETADVISVYVFHKPVFIVDAYSRRFLMKLGLNFDTDEEIKRFFEKVSERIIVCSAGFIG